jgi:hypothetical protein
MGVLFHGTAATNGFDSVGHYIRTEALVGGCTGYAKTPVPGCSANFTHTGVAADAATAAAALDPGAGAHGSKASRRGGGPANAGASPGTAKVTAAVRRARASGIQPATTAAVSGLLHYLIGNGE